MRAVLAIAAAGLALGASASARPPAAVESTSYPWVQLPASIELVAVTPFHGMTTSYGWAQPPASVPIS